jgi:hypothetical protein
MGSKEPLEDHLAHGTCLLCSEEIIRAAWRKAEGSPCPPWRESPKAATPALVEKQLAEHRLILPPETLHG